jgi:hypothetical protein
MSFRNLEVPCPRNPPIKKAPRVAGQFPCTRRRGSNFSRWDWLQPLRGNKLADFGDKQAASPLPRNALDNDSVCEARSEGIDQEPRLLKNTAIGDTGTVRKTNAITRRRS